MTHSINLNDDVKVRLTPEGRRVFVSYWVKALERSYLRVPELHCDENDLSTFHLWDLMQIFGPEIYMGGPQLFEKNLVYFEVDN